MTVHDDQRPLTALTPKLLSLLRVVGGLTFMEHGAQKLLGFPASAAMPAMYSLPW